MSVLKISTIDELIELSSQNLKNQTKLFRGQDKNYSTTPSASRQITLKNNPVYKKDFEKFIEEFKLINPSICHDKVARTFSKILMYPSYLPWINKEKSEIENELVQLLLQVLRQQYSRSALLLDVTKDLAVSSFFTNGTNELL